MTPLVAALWSLLPSVLVGAAAPVADQLAARSGRGPVMAGGMLLASVGFAVVSQVQVGSPLAVVLTGAGVLAVGLVAVLTLVTQVVLAAPSRWRCSCLTPRPRRCWDRPGTRSWQGCTPRASPESPCWVRSATC
jgi:DHA2 family multidrug resistance protein-like MFS transporter